MTDNSTPAPMSAKPIHVARWGSLECRYFLPPSGRLTLPFSPMTDVVNLLKMTAQKSVIAERVFIEGPYCDILVWISTERGRERMIPHDYAAAFLSAIVEHKNGHPKAEKRFLEGSATAIQKITASTDFSDFERKRGELLRNVAEDRAIQIEGDVA